MLGHQEGSGKAAACGAGRLLAVALPGPLLNELSTVVLVLPDGQVNLRHGHDGQVQALAHMPTPTDHLTTGGRPSGLTRFACPMSFKNSQGDRIPGTCPPLPLLPDGEGRSDGDSFALPQLVQFWRYPRRAAGRSRGNRSGA